MKKRSVILWILLNLLVVLGGLSWIAWQNASERKREVLGPDAAPATAEEVIKYTCGMHPFVVKDEPGNCPICGMKLTPVKEGDLKKTRKTSGERKIKYWVAPMDPTYIRNEPGKSPMGMDLVPVYEDEAPEGPNIRIDPVVEQNMGVRTAPVERRTLHRNISTVGLVNYNEERVYSVNSKVDGWIEKLHIDQTGQVVKKGQPMLEIYSPELVSAQEEYLLALQNRSKLQESAYPQISEGADRLLQSARKRLQLWDISESQIRQLVKNGKVRKAVTLFSPFDGIVTMKMAFEGQYIKAGMELFKLGDISRVWVIADIYEYELPWIQVGQEAVIRLPFVGGETISGKITYIYPYVEPKTRTVKARLEFDNPGYELKPDMYVNVRIRAQEVQDVLAVPAEAVLYSGEKRRVFVASGNGKFEPRQVKTGLQGQDGYIQVRQGLLEGENVVTSSQFMFDSESRLREAIQKMLEPERGEPSGKAEQDSMEDLFQDEEKKSGKKEELEDLFK